MPRSDPSQLANQLTINFGLGARRRVYIVERSSYSNAAKRQTRFVRYTGAPFPSHWEIATYVIVSQTIFGADQNFQMCEQAESFRELLLAQSPAS